MSTVAGSERQHREDEADPGQQRRLVNQRRVRGPIDRADQREEERRRKDHRDEQELQGAIQAQR